MNRRRIEGVLRVRRIQERLAAQQLAAAVRTRQDLEAALDLRRERYEQERATDTYTGSAGGAVEARVVRELHAGAIVRGRHDVAVAEVVVDDRRSDLVVRSQAVKGLEKLDERLADEHAEHAKRELEKLVDDLTVSRHGRSRR